jgi:hypothetical protein
MMDWEIPEALNPKPDEVLGNVAVYRKNGAVLLVLLTKRVCEHRTFDGSYEYHVRYYVTVDRPSNELERLVEWLEAGFWWDSWCVDPQPIINEFLRGGCMHPEHFGER